VIIFFNVYALIGLILAIIGLVLGMQVKKEQPESTNAKVGVVLCIIGIAVISVGIVLLIGSSVYKNINRVKPSSNYSAYLNDDGLIKDVTATDHLDLVDYANITVPLSEVEYSDEAVEEDIKTMLNEKATLDKETDAVIADGDKVNADYVGSIDGVEFEGGNTAGQGSDITIGAGKLIDDFEEQLIGHSIGDTVEVLVTFPDDYSNAELAGKDAVFEVVINGIYVTPEFTDEYVKENLSEYATTVTEYKEYLKKSNYEQNLAKWLDDYMMKETTVTSYPEKYTNHIKSTKKYDDQSAYEYMNQLYASMGYAGFNSLEEYVEMTEAKYDESLVDVARAQAKKALIYQAIYELEELSVTKEDYPGDDFDTRVEQYGKGYVMQELVINKSLDRVIELITVK